MFNLNKAVLALPLVCLMATSAEACDLCSIYSAVGANSFEAGALRLSVSEQFTYQNRIQEKGHYVDNEMHQHLASSITQFVAAYDLSNRFSLQTNLPYINRRFKRIEGESLNEATETGLGDLSLLVKYLPFRYQEEELNSFVQIYSGIKLPTGDTDRLGEELEEDGSHGEEGLHGIDPHHGGVHHEESVKPIHGHDLALGSGSYDVPVGVNAFVGHGKAYLLADIQYMFRTEGDFNYRYANDLTWDVGPGYYLITEHEHSLSLRANLSGEYKAKDKVNSQTEDDTSVNSLFLGPEILVTGEKMSGDVGVDFPLDINNSGTQLVSSYRIRLGLTYRF